jgi:hypothetical protein
MSKYLRQADLVREPLTVNELKAKNRVALSFQSCVCTAPSGFWQEDPSGHLRCRRHIKEFFSSSHLEDNERINSTGALRIRFPKAALNSTCSQWLFDNKYRVGHINCIGVIDGYLARIKVPTAGRNVRHTSLPVLWCQYSSCGWPLPHGFHYWIGCPGVTADQDALEQCGRLYEVIEALPLNVHHSRRGVRYRKDGAVYQGYEKTFL